MRFTPENAAEFGRRGQASRLINLARRKAEALNPPPVPIAPPPLATLTAPPPLNGNRYAVHRLKRLRALIRMIENRIGPSTPAADIGQLARALAFLHPQESDLAGRHRPALMRAPRPPVKPQRSAPARRPGDVQPISPPDSTPPDPMPPAASA